MQLKKLNRRLTRGNQVEDFVLCPNHKMILVDVVGKDGRLLRRYCPVRGCSHLRVYDEGTFDENLNALKDKFNSKE